MTIETEPLVDSLTLIAGETPASFVSRLAASTLSASAREFCADFLLSFDRIAAGDEQEIAKLAALGSASLEELLRNAPRRVSVHEFQIGDAVVPRAIAKRNSVRLCPACAAKDIADARHQRADAAVAGRSMWLIGPIRTCPDHHLALVEVQKVDRPARLHDFALAAAEALEDLGPVFERSERRPFSPFERYICDRIWPHNARPTYPLLDKLSAADAAMACEWMGRFRLCGPKSWPSAVSDAEMYAAAQSGFEILASGPRRLRRLIVASHAQTEPLAGSSGRARYLLGALFHFLDTGAGSKSTFEPIRRVIATTLCDLYPYGPGDGRLLGIPITRRQVHSLSTAAAAYGMSIATVRSYAHGAQITRPAHRKGDSKQILIDAAAADELFGATGQVLSATDVFRIHGVSLQTLRELASPSLRLLRPVGGRFKAEGTTHFRKCDVDDLRSTLSAQSRSHAPTEMVPLSEAAQQSAMSVAQVIKRLLVGDVGCVAVDGHRANMGVHVDIGALRQLPTSAVIRGYSLREAARYLKVSEPVVVKLSELGVLPTARERRRLTGRWRTTYLAADIERFEQTYVTLSELRRQHGWNAQVAVARMKAASIFPAFNPAKAGCTIFERARLQNSI